MRTGSRFTLRPLAKVTIIAQLYIFLVSSCFAAFTLDSTFNGGKVTISFPNSSSNYSSQAFRVFVQPNCRVVLAGSFTNGTADGQLTGVAWVGLTTVGALDPAFGSGGTSTNWRSDAFTNFKDGVMYPDGSTLYMAQVFRLPVGSSTVNAARLDANGHVDGVFVSNASIGPCCLGFFTAQPVQIAVRNDGRVLGLIADQGAYLMHRLHPDGTRDTTFGVNGVSVLVFNKFSPRVIEMIPLSDGKTLIVGSAGPSDPNLGSSELFIARLTDHGGWDKTFGRVGFVRAPIAAGMTGFVRSAVLQPDGKILIAGNIVNSDADVWLARFSSNGRRDTTFGDNGVAIRDLAPGDTDVANSIALSLDGKIRIAGQIGQSTPAFLVARFSSNGTLEDQTSVSFSPGLPAVANDVTVQPDGKVIVAGYAKNPIQTITGNVMAIARFTE